MNVFVLADSISIHYGPSLQAYLGSQIGYARKSGEQEALLNLDKPAGSNGGDSQMVLSFLRAQALAGGLDADVILVNCGLHDIKSSPETGQRQVPLERYEENLRQIIATVHSMGKTMIWVRTTPVVDAIHNERSKAFYRYERDAEAYNRAADQIMDSHAVTMIDLEAFTRALGPDLYCDHVHFHEPIRQLQGAFIAGWLLGWQRGRDVQ